MRLKTSLAALLLAATSLLAGAQGTGTWVTHTRFAGTSIQDLVDAGDNVYYVANHGLFCFNKLTKTTSALNKSNGSLTSNLVTGIYYNPDKAYLVVTFDDCDIDVLTPDGRVTSVPAVKDAVTYRNKTINDVTFGNGRIYVALGCGYITLDDSTLNVRESHYMGYNLPSVEKMGKWLLVSCVNSNVYYTPVASPVDNIAYAPSVAMPYGKVRTVNDSTFLLLHSSGLIRYTATPSGTSKLTFKADTLLREACTNIQATPSGFIVNNLTSGYYYTLDAQGQNLTKVTGGKELWSAAPGGDGTLWGIGASGLHSSAASGTYYKPNGINLTGIPFYMAYNYPQRKLYLGILADNQLLPSNKYANALVLNTYDGSKWADVSPTTNPKPSSSGWYNILFDPNDPTSIWMAGRYGQVVRISTETNQMTANFYMQNVGGVGRRAGMAFDGQGNLVLGQSSLSSTTLNSLFVLPKEKLHQSSYAASDFVVMQVPHMKDYNAFKGIQLVAAKHSGMKVFTNGAYSQDLIFIRTDSTTGVFETKNFGSVPNEKGGNITWTYTYGMDINCHDQVAVGTIEGFFIFDPAKAFDANFAASAPSIFSSVQVNAVTSDAQGNWWVGTNDAGIYQISEDGNTVLQHLDTSTGLLTNCIYQLCIDTVGGSLYVTTPLGLQEYKASSNAAQDLSAVKAYPNPVRPDFTGLITISGLTEGCSVIVKDAAGNQVATLTPRGGIALWDASDATGNRLPTGTYGIYAAQSGEQFPATPQATVMLIK